MFLKFLLIIATIITIGSTAPGTKRPVKIVSYSYDPLDENSQYRYEYRTSDGQVREEEGTFLEDEDGKLNFIVHGSYQYVGPDGVLYTVTYTADENGFRPEGDHLPGASSTTTEEPVGLPHNAVISLIG